MSSKNTLPFAGRFVFLGIQPLPAASAQLRSRCSHHHAFPDSTWRSFGLDLSADKQLGGSMANHGSI
jgi:hypothetical protein